MQAYKIMAKNTRTGVRIQRQFLTGQLITDLESAWREAQQLAESQSSRDREAWVADISLYIVGSKPGSQ
jgi:hypothetical protein